MALSECIRAFAATISFCGKYDYARFGVSCTHGNDIVASQFL